MTEQSCCALCGAAGHVAAQCNWNERRLTFTPDSLAAALNDVQCLSDLGPELIAASVFRQHPEQAEGTQGERERFEAWWNDPAQWELRKSCAMGWGEKIWRAAQGALAKQVPEWSSAKPTVEGAYWVRGNGLNEPAVIRVKLDQGELWCNLHMNNTETDFGYGYTIAQLSSEFEWFGPLAAAPVAQAGQVPQAWLDVQAERRRQVAAEGWTPEHDNEHDHGQMARAAACYALAGSSAADDKTTALLVSLAWPWDQQWWKPTTARRDLVKACALTLAEIERLDRAAAPTAGGSDA